MNEPCPTCEGKGVAPRVSTVSGERTGWHVWPCPQCNGTRVIKVDPERDTIPSPPMEACDGHE